MMLRLTRGALSILPLLLTRCPFHKFAASQAAVRLYGLGGYKARSNRVGRELNHARP